MKFCIYHKDLSFLPALYLTNRMPFIDRLLYLHFFLLNIDWYVMEFDGKDTFYGVITLHGKHTMIEWGYFSFTGLANAVLYGVKTTWDERWQPVPLKTVFPHLT